MAAKPTMVNFGKQHKVWGEDKNVVAEVITITPADATSWLKGNNNNRPIRPRHVAFLAREMLEGNWQVNGQAIIIAEDEQVLDGQHRLLAIIDSGKTIQSLVVYGITEDAFKTIDTGAVRSSSDALHMHFKEAPTYALHAAATAVNWCHRLERGMGKHVRVSNTDAIEYVKRHSSLIAHAETLQGFPHEARPLSIGIGTALYEMFGRKNEPEADRFMKGFYTGEELNRTDPEYLLRGALIRDAQRTAKLPSEVRVRMVIKGWNWRRRGNTEASRQVIAVSANDEPKVKIY
jgi:hypothetical protein